MLSSVVSSLNPFARKSSQLPPPSTADSKKDSIRFDDGELNERPSGRRSEGNRYIANNDIPATTTEHIPPGGSEFYSEGGESEDEEEDASSDDFMSDSPFKTPPPPPADGRSGRAEDRRQEESDISHIDSCFTQEKAVDYVDSDGLLGYQQADFSGFTYTPSPNEEPMIQPVVVDNDRRESARDLPQQQQPETERERESESRRGRREKQQEEGGKMKRKKESAKPEPLSTSSSSFASSPSPSSSSSLPSASPLRSPHSGPSSSGFGIPTTTTVSSGRFSDVSIYRHWYITIDLSFV